jgi:hypothetical protein
MRIAPPKRPPASKPVALIRPGWHAMTVETSEGITTLRGAENCFNALVRLQDHILYTESGPARMRTTTGARCWQAAAWRGRVTDARLDGTRVKVRSLRGTLEGSTDPYGDLLVALDWLHANGAPPASLSSMSWRLWASTLPAEVRIGALPRVGRAALYGGRQGIRRPGTFSHMVCADLVAAYPHTMACTPYALALRRVASDTVLDPTVAGIVIGTVQVDEDMPFGPVPERIARDMIRFPRGQVCGAWSWAEAQMAEEIGCTVLVDECWAPKTESDLFSRWWKVVAEGRTLPGNAARVAKAVANCLWGQFGMRADDVEVIRWRDDAGTQPIRRARKPRKTPHAWTAHIAAETTARVRVKMYGEINRRASLGSPVHIDTDGMIGRRSMFDDMPTSAGPGAFRVKQAMRRVEIRAPQVYRFLCPNGCGQTHPAYHYSVAGMPSEAARRVFEKVGREGCTVSFTGNDTVLPAHNAQDFDAKRRGVLQALSVAGIMG